MNAPDISIEPLPQLDLPLMEAIILRGRVHAARWVVPACYDCESPAPLVSWRGRALCDPCRAFAKVRDGGR